MSKVIEERSKKLLERGGRERGIRKEGSGERGGRKEPRHKGGRGERAREQRERTERYVYVYWERLRGRERRGRETLGERERESGEIELKESLPPNHIIYSSSRFRSTLRARSTCSRCTRSGPSTTSAS